ncbi:MAG: phosphodiester glycosidase family protein [Armatimonadota bacterium]
MGATARSTEGVVRLTMLPPFGNTSEQRSAHIHRTWGIIEGVGVNVVRINPAPPRVRIMPGFARDADPQRGYFPFESFRNIVERYKPRVAINGTYFNMVNGQPTGSIVRFDTFLYQGQCGTAIRFYEDGRINFRFPNEPDHYSFQDVQHAICTGPTLVRDGKFYLYPRAEGFYDPGVLGTARRSAIGLTKSGKVLLVTVHTEIPLETLARIMVRLDCRHAANLDGGSSSALYSNGAYITVPGRKLSNVILVYD